MCLVFLGSYMRIILLGRRRFHGGHRYPYFSKNRHLDEPGEPLDGLNFFGLLFYFYSS
jgi:hypothetical protein